ncbi:MAG TPA: winged helix-turn-helix domain-containing protein [Thermoanaerobaculia bacterium]|nr:winged helix-turn-helix domain-containing protein [Thermoanaerobaculia bacterium]
MDERLNLHRFGPFTLDARSEVLLRGAERVPLQPQPMKVLLVLASRRGELVTRKELQSAVWSDGTFVDFEQGLNWCIKRIREVLGDDANQPRFIETVPRKGYRFIAQAQVRDRRWLATAAMLALVCVAASAAWRPAPPVTVVILPFDNFTGDARNDMSATIATEEVINRVGSVDPARLKVIDRLTAAKFKRTNECIIHIGRQLRADFVMEGSLQRQHATAALYRVADNTQVWATAVDPHIEAASSIISNKIASTFR